MDYLVVKSSSLQQHIEDLAELFSTLNQNNMRLNPEKYVFRVDGGKFLVFMPMN